MNSFPGGSWISSHTTVDSNNQSHKSSQEDGRATGFGVGEGASYLKPRTRAYGVYASTEKMGRRVLRLVCWHLQ